MLDDKPNGIIGVVVSVSIHIVFLLLLIGGFFAGKDLPEASPLPAPFAIQLAPLQSMVDQVAAKPVLRPVKQKKILEPKLEVANKAKIVVEKKELIEENAKKIIEKQENIDSIQDDEKSTKNDDGDSSQSSRSSAGDIGSTKASPVIGDHVTAGQADAEQSWLLVLYQRLERYKKYPTEARRLTKASGIVKVRLVVDSKGKVISTKLVSGSGNIYLDRAATSLPNRASPLPAPPAKMLNGQSSISIIIPINYSIR